MACARARPSSSVVASLALFVLAITLPALVLTQGHPKGTRDLASLETEHAPDAGLRSTSQDPEPRRVLEETQGDQEPSQSEDDTPPKSQRRRRRPTLGARGGPFRPSTPCWSCSEKKLFYPESVLTFGSPGMPGLADTLEAYTVMHHKCVAGIQDWGAFYDDQSQGVKEGSHVEGCKYLLYSTPDAKTSIPERLLGVVSVFLYGLLTNRALLISSQNLPFAHLFADPFLPSSSWIVPFAQFQKLREDVQSHGLQNTGTGDNWDGRRLSVVLKKSAPEYGWGFFCPEEQQAVARAQFMVFSSDLFFAPLLYKLPSFKEELERLIPSRRVFLRVAHFLLNPSNAVWDRITRVYQGQMAHSDLLVGMELNDVVLSPDAQSVMLDQALKCGQEEAGSLPDVISSDDWRSQAAHADDMVLRRSVGSSVSVFVATSNVTNAERLRALYTYGKPKDGSAVSVHSEADLLEWEEYESERAEHTLSDLWVLSFSDVLVTTEGSALGTTAAALGGLNPHVVPIPGEKDGKAEASPEKCFLGFVQPCLRVLPPDGVLKCSKGFSLTMSEETEGLRKCPGRDAGITLLLPQDTS